MGCIAVLSDVIGAFGTGLLVGLSVGAGAAWHLKPNWLKSSGEHRDHIYQEISRIVNVEQAETIARRRKVELMRAKRKTQRVEDNPKQPLVVHKVRRRRRPIRLPTEGE